VPQSLLSIGELAARTGVAVTALRYYDELGLVRPCARASGQRRYAESAVRGVGVVLFLRDVGFSLAEIADLTGDAARPDRWAPVIERKLIEIAERQHRLAVARTALEHARECPAEHPARCPRFWTIIDAVVDGASVEEAHHGWAAGQRQADVVGPSGQIE
jgi:DNA-binding transcriptional MerR regulator